MCVPNLVLVSQNEQYVSYAAPLYLIILVIYVVRYVSLYYKNGSRYVWVWADYVNVLHVYLYLFLGIS